MDQQMEPSVRIDVSELRSNLGAQQSHTFEIHVPPTGMGFEAVEFAPVKTEVTLTNAGDCIVATGSVSTTATLKCSRCMEEYDLQLKAPFKVQFKSRTPHLEDDEADEELVYYSGDEIDLGSVIRDVLILSVPMKPICRPDCKGLCPVCGQNLNVAECGCNRDQTDLRLTKLADFFNLKE